MYSISIARNAQLPNPSFQLQHVPSHFSTFSIDLVIETSAWQEIILMNIHMMFCWSFRSTKYLQIDPQSCSDPLPMEINRTFCAKWNIYYNK